MKVLIAFGDWVVWIFAGVLIYVVTFGATSILSAVCSIMNAHPGYSLGGIVIIAGIVSFFDNFKITPIK